MKSRIAFVWLVLAAALQGQAKDVTVKSPNGALVVTVSNNDGRLTYGVTMDGQTVLRESALGLRTSIGDLTQGLTLTDTKENRVEAHYDMQKTKAGHSDYVANELTATLKNDEKRVLQVTFRVSNDDVAFRYSIAVEHPERPGAYAAVDEGALCQFRHLLHPQRHPQG